MSLWVDHCAWHFACILLWRCLGTWDEWAGCLSEFSTAHWFSSHHSERSFFPFFGRLSPWIYQPKQETLTRLRAELVSYQGLGRLPSAGANAFKYSIGGRLRFFHFYCLFAVGRIGFVPGHSSFDSLSLSSLAPSGVGLNGRGLLSGNFASDFLLSTV